MSFRNRHRSKRITFENIGNKYILQEITSWFCNDTNYQLNSQSQNKSLQRKKVIGKCLYHNQHRTLKDKILHTTPTHKQRIKHYYTPTPKKKIKKYWSYKTNLNVWCSNLRVLLICPCNKDIPKHWPPFEQKATRSIYGCHSHKYKYTIHYNIKPQKQWFKIGECRRIHWTIILPTGSDETLPSAWNAWAVALRSLLTK